jgi:hypothetical protein
MPGKQSSRKAVKPASKKSRSTKAGKGSKKKAAPRKSTKTAVKSRRAGKRTSTTRLARSLPAFLTQSTEMDRLLAAKAEWSSMLLRPRPAREFRSLASATSPSPENNVVGVGIGERMQAGRHTGVVALKFLVRVKYGDDHLTSSDRLPESVNGLPTDVEEVGTFRPFQIQDPRTMIRPCSPGCSVGFQDPTGQFLNAGTFGALVKRGARRFVLSNNHVLADENQLPVGAPTFQPGFLDAGSPPTTGPIATLSAFRTLEPAQPNAVDCAISEISDPSLVTNSIIKIGVPNGIAPALSSMIVHKFGRTTGYRVGFVDATMMDVSVDYNIGTLKFDDQIIIKGLNGEPFSDEGDSGALVVERTTSRAVGLLFAGSASHTIANHIDDVLQALNVTLA